MKSAHTLPLHSSLPGTLHNYSVSVQPPSLESRDQLCFFMEQRPAQVCITCNWLPILPHWTSLFPHFCCPVKHGEHWALKFHLRLCLVKTLGNAAWRGWLPFKAKLGGQAGRGAEGRKEEFWAQTGWEAYVPSTPIAILAFIFKSM